MNDPGCVVTPSPGAGRTELPFARDSDGGDGDAFDTNGSVLVQVTNFNGNSECKFVLHDAGDGRPLAVGTVRPPGEPLVLDPGGQSSVYIESPHCGAHMTAR